MVEKILPSTDNFFKYLLTVGVILIFFAILYPLQKQQEIDLAINEYKKNVEIYEYKVGLLETNTQSLENLMVKSNEEIQRLNSLKKNGMLNVDSLQNRMFLLKKDFDLKKADAIKKGEELKQVQIAQKYEEEKIRKMSGYLSSYFFVKIFCLIVGVVLFALGLLFWASTAYLDEEIKVNNASIPYKHSYVRFCDWISIVIIRKKKEGSDLPAGTDDKK